MKIATFLATCGLLVLASPSSAQPGPPAGAGRGYGAMMSKIDLNGDGVISAAEHRQWAEEVFATLDSNKDGKLSREEYLAMHMGPGPRGGANRTRIEEMRKQADARKREQFTSMDTDKNGFVTRAEFLAHAGRTFAAKDINKDDNLSAREFRSWHTSQ